MTNIKKFEFELEGISPIKMHRFNGQDEEKKLRERSTTEQAEKHAYRLTNGNLGLPSNWIYGSLLNAFVALAGRKEKTATKMETGSRIRVEPFMLDLGVKDYEIDIASAPAGNMSRGGTRDEFVKPVIKAWKVKGIIQTTLGKSLEDMKSYLEYAGTDVGIGSDRPHGYGRFKVISFKQI